MTRQKWISKSFRRGFREGFGAPTSLFIPMNYNRVLLYNQGVEGAWKKVADTLGAATTMVGSEIRERRNGGGLIGESSRENCITRG